MFRMSAGLAVLGLLVGLASAQPQNYAQRGTQIRAGIALLDSAQTAGVPSNPTPFVWYNLDANRSVKPAGWNIFNPNAPSQATQAISNRWTLIAGVVGGGSPGVGERITKRNAAYWEVQISQATESQMANYDVLLINASGNINLNTIERERLRNFVDRGGVLWVETANTNATFNTLYSINNFPLPFSVVPGGAGLGNLDIFHPVLSYPYTFNISNLDYLNNGGVGPVLNQATSVGAAAALNQSITADWFKLKPVVLQNGAASMMVGRLGDGFMVVTTRSAANYVNQVRTPTGYFANNQYYAGEVRGGFDKGSDVLGKLAVNMISLGSGSEQPSNGSRKSGSSPIDIGAPLLKRFDADINGLDFGPKNQFPAAAYKGLAVVSANDRIYVYDANPKSDIDGNGNPDDGVPDYSLGNNLDLIWSSNALAGPISAPTCAEVAQPAAGVPSDQIMVTLADGTVAVFDAFAGNPAPAYSVAPPSIVSGVSTAELNHGPYAPTIHESLAYVSTNPGTPASGQVWMFNPADGLKLQTGGQNWLVGDPLAPAFQQTLSASPTVGYIPIADNSGGFDRIVYVPGRPGTPSGPNAGIYSLWGGTRGEAPTAFNVTGPVLTVTTRAAQRGLWLVTTPGSLGIKLTVLDQFGNPLDSGQINALLGPSITQSSPGILDFQVIGAWNVNYTVRVDYTVDWGRGPAASAAIIRGNIFLPDDPTNRRTILGNIAMSGRGTIYVVHSTTIETSGGEGGAFYAFREQGQGAFKCITRYDVYRRHTITTNQSQINQVAATISDNDPLLGLVGIMQGTSDRMTFVSGPVVRGDYVYATAVLRKTSGVFFLPFIPFTTILAFKSEPEAPEIQVGDLSDGFTLVQPDMIRSQNKSTPNQLSVGTSPGQFQYIRESGKIRFDSLMTPNRGQINNCLSLSMPVIIRSGGRPDQLVYPDSIAGSRWSPLSWYTVLHGTGDATTPVVTGNTLFIGGASSLPYFVTLAGAPIIPPPTNGVLFGINADISERDPFTIPDNARPWNRQAVVLKVNGPDIDVNPNIRWPQNAGIRSFNAWAQRVLQASMPGTARTMSIAAGEGGLFATGAISATPAFGSNGKLFAFNRADFLVADEGRLGRYDPAGNPIFATDVSNNAGQEVNVGGATSVKAIQRPIRAYPIGATDTVVVDPGTNRIIRIDGSGRELRSLEGFRVDPASNITLAANEPLTFNNPRDVAVFTEFVANPVGVTNPQALEYWVHYVVADAGNRRVIDLIDRYYVGAGRVVGDIIQVAGGQRQLGMLRWHSPDEYTGKRFEYNAIARSYDWNTGRYFYIAGLGNSTPARVDIGLDTPGGTLPRESSDGNGGIVIFDPLGPANNSVINEVIVPQVALGSLINPVSGGYDFNPARAEYQLNRVKKLSGMTSVTVRNVPFGVNSSRWAIMFTDSTGVYEVIQAVANGPWVVRWMLPNSVYKFMRKNIEPSLMNIFSNNPLQLRATYARRLDSDEVLVVNGYVGKRWDGADFSGEVVQVDGDFFTGGASRGFAFNRPNLGFDFASVRFELNLLTETRKLYQPVFADRR